MNWKYFSLTLAVCCLAGALLSANLNKPFYGHHEFNGVFYGQIARNYLTYGLVTTKLAQVTSPQDVMPAAWGYHTHHPAAYPLLLTGFFKVFGVHEWVSRLISIVATLVSIIIIIGIIRPSFQSPLAALVVIPITVTPLFLYYAKLPVFEPLLLPLTLWLYWSYQQQKWRQLWWSAFGLIILDWPGYWPVLVLGVYHLITVKQLDQVIVKLATAGIAGTGVILLLQWISYGQPLAGLLEIGGYRLATAPYATLAWLHTLISRLKAFYGLPLLASAAAGTGYALFHREHPLFRLLLVSFVSGWLHMLIFRNITWYHDYMLYHLIPFFVFSLTFLVMWIATVFRSRLTIPLVIGLITLATWQQTHVFYQALAAMTPHQDCYQIGIAARSEKTPAARTLSQEKSGECGPFINFYANKTVPIISQ